MPPNGGILFALLCCRDRGPFLGKRSGSPSSEAAICNRFIGKSRRAKRARRDVVRIIRRRRSIVQAAGFRCDAYAKPFGNASGLLRRLPASPDFEHEKAPQAIWSL